MGAESTDHEVTRRLALDLMAQNRDGTKRLPGEPGADEIRGEIVACGITGM